MKQQYVIVNFKQNVCPFIYIWFISHIFSNQILTMYSPPSYVHALEKSFLINVY